MTRGGTTSTRTGAQAAATKKEFAHYVTGFVEIHIMIELELMRVKG